MTDAPRRSNRLLVWVILGSFALWLALYALHSKGFTSSDEMSYAEVARNVMRGEGLVQQTLHPGFVPYFGGAPRQPYFVHAPLYPLLLAAVFRVTGPSDAAVVWLSGIFFILNMALLFLLAQRLYQDGRLALLSVLFLATSGQILWYSLAGMVEMVHSALILLWVLVLGWRPSRRWMAAAGILLGLAYLVRQSAGLLVPLAAIYLIWEGRASGRSLMRSGRLFGCFLAVFLLSIFPEAYRTFHHLRSFQNPVVRNLLLYGTPISDSGWFFILDHPMNHVSPWAYFLSHPEELVQKALTYGRFLIVVAIPALVSPYVWHLPLGGMVGEWQRQPIIRFKLLVWAAFALFCAVSSVTFPTTQYLLFFVPFFSMFAAESVLWAWQRLRQSARPFGALVMTAVIAYFLLPHAVDLGLILSKQRSRPGDLALSLESRRALGQFVASNTAPDDVLVTSMASITSWYGDRASMIYSAAPSYRFADSPMWREIDRHIGIDYVLYATFAGEDPRTPVFPEFQLFKTENCGEFMAYLFKRQERS